MISGQVANLDLKLFPLGIVRVGHSDTIGNLEKCHNCVGYCVALFDRDCKAIANGSRNAIANVVIRGAEFSPILGE